jgi:hypothetical protein
MNTRALSAAGTALGLAVLLGGCVGSDEPVIPESEAIFDPRLVGTWVALSFLPDVEGDQSFMLLGRLGHLDEHLVMEVSPYLSSDDPPAREYNLAVLEFDPIPESQIGPDELLVRMLSADHLAEALESGELHLAHRRIGKNEVILENPTLELRDELVAYLELPDVLIAFDGPFRRITDASLVGPWHEVDAPCLQAEEETP